MDAVDRGQQVSFDRVRRRAAAVAEMGDDAVLFVDLDAGRAQLGSRLSSVSSRIACGRRLMPTPSGAGRGDRLEHHRRAVRPTRGEPARNEACAARGGTRSVPTILSYNLIANVAKEERLVALESACDLMVRI
jgi:hypothetical protein